MVHTAASEGFVFTPMIRYECVHCGLRVSVSTLLGGQLYYFVDIKDMPQDHVIPSTINFTSSLVTFIVGQGWSQNSYIFACSILRCEHLDKIRTLQHNNMVPYCGILLTYLFGKYTKPSQGCILYNCDTYSFSKASNEYNPANEGKGDKYRNNLCTHADK